MLRQIFAAHVALLLASLVSVLTLTPSLGWAQADNGTEAVELVRNKTEELIALLKQNRSLYERDEARFYKDIDNLLAPVIDIERIARRVMARYYRDANEAQQQRFVEVFKQSLMSIYAKGLLQYDNQRVEILPPGRGAAARPDSQRVDVNVYDTDGKRYPLSYSMFREGGQWKIENIVVNGINVGLTYRNQFARLMREKGNDMDRVIASWTSEVREGDANENI